jgi:hypothetical protein
MEMKVTVFFGTIEYFEREFLSYAAKKHLFSLSSDHILAIYSSLKNELLHDFICADGLRMECLENLNIACKNYINQEMRVTS